jgi:hypothetical protein
MVKLDHFPVFSGKKTEKNKFFRKESQNSQNTHLSFKLIEWALVAPWIFAGVSL